MPCASASSRSSATLLTGEYFASHKETLETLGALAERKETELRVKLAQ